MNREINKDRICGIIMLAISLLFAYYTTGIKDTDVVGDPGPKLFPFIACFLIGIFSIGLILRKNSAPYKPYMTWQQWRRYWTLYSLYVLNYLTLHYIGYKVAIPLTLCLTCFLLSKGSGVPAWKKVLYVIVVASALIVIYTMLLKVNLPAGKLHL